jgi:hypothetical protein
VAGLCHLATSGVSSTKPFERSLQVSGLFVVPHQGGRALLLDTLQNFAEVGIAVAGFSGVAAALGSRAGESWAHSKRRSLQVLLETAGMVVLFSFVPQILSRSVLTEVNLWWVSGSLYAGSHVLHGLTLK